MVSYSASVIDAVNAMDVLILVVVEDGLVQRRGARESEERQVLILVVVEDGLVLTALSASKGKGAS